MPYQAKPNFLNVEEGFELTAGSAVGSSTDVAAKQSIYISNNTATPDVSSSTITSTVQSIQKIPVSTDINSSTAGQTSSAASTTYKAIPQGASAVGGPVTSKTSSRYPNIYINFRNNTFDSRSMTFWFKTSDISSSAGTTSTTWASDSSLINGLSLTGAANSLKVISAYNNKFYELQAGKTISNTSFNLNPSSQPSYTILVFALANPNVVTVKQLVDDCNKIHKFCEKGDTSTFYNLSYSNPLADFTKLSSNQVFRSSFFGSTLNNKNYINSVYMDGYNNINITDPSFLSMFDTFYKNSLQTVQGSIAFPQKYIAHRGFNIAGLPTNLAAPTTPVDFTLNDGSSVNMKTFSLFFVEMYGYVTDNADSRFKVLNVENRINGIQTFVGKMNLQADIIFDPATQFDIRLSNPNTSISTRLFLFDYIHGTAYSQDLMRQQSQKIVEGLAYQYRNILLKSTTDLQITNSSSSLLLPPSIAHPFLNMFAKEG